MDREDVKSGLFKGQLDLDRWDGGQKDLEDFEAKKEKKGSD